MNNSFLWLHSFEKNTLQTHWAKNNFAKHISISRKTKSLIEVTKKNSELKHELLVAKFGSLSTNFI